MTDWTPPMFTRDPYDVPTPQAPRPEVPDHIREFWGQVPDMRPTVPSRQTPATLNICRFMPAERRVYHIRGGCPHFPSEDQ